MDNASWVTLIVGVVGIATSLIFLFLERTGMLKQRWALAMIGILSVILYGVALWLFAHNWYWVFILEIVGILGVSYIVFKVYHPRIETAARNTPHPTSQAICFAEIIHESRHDKERKSLISVKASEKELLLIEASVAISDSESKIRKLIDDTYNRLDVAAQRLVRLKARYPEFISDIDNLLNLLENQQARLNRIRKYEETLDKSKSEIDEDAGNIIKAIDDILSKQIYQNKDTNVKPRDFEIVWLSEEFSLRGSHNDYHSYNSTEEEGKISLVVKPQIRVNTLKLIQVQSLALLIGTKEIPSDMEDVNVFGESETVDDIKFEFPLDTSRGKQLAKIKAIVDGREYITSSFLIDFPRRN